ncbi:MAG: alcohol dehydrogenase catalytic domain-containing protein, partial [Candidatus Dormibacteraeota bacterium]|nr:alcohol dehydrogenase catalytic domain-containing protein [Candidatus Dormibacteraeota bacterium]
MRALVVTRRGPPEVLQVQDRHDPEPGDGQVRIRVEAAGLNFADLLARAGVYPDSPRTPCVLGYEVSGVVDVAGAGVDGIKPGARVLAATRFGGQAELAVANASDCIELPSGISTPAAAAIPVNYATAYAGLVLMAGLRQGERVLIHSAAGGVGTAATQIAHHLGAVVVGTASASKHDHVRAQGAAHVID